VDGVEEVAQDGEQPSVEVRPTLEAVDRRPGAHQRFLDEVVRPIGVIGQGEREGAQARHGAEKGVAELRVDGRAVHGPSLLQ
jgi:hypothetical protein